MDSSTALIVLNAFLLGLRHGIDWDHLAAIFDIVSGSTADGNASPAAFKDSFWGAFAYSTGHGLIVIILGAASICLSATLPGWIDPIMEKVVGLTLVFLSVWVFGSAFFSFRQGGMENMTVPSRYSLLSRLYHRFFYFMNKHNAGIRSSAGGGMAAGLSGSFEAPGASGASSAAGAPKAAFAIGAMHGIGAETGTQILLLTAVASASQAIGLSMLFAFVLGLITCNMAVVVLGASGFVSASKVKPVMIALAIATGVFSLAVGVIFLGGWGELLPDFEKILP
ncbi:MAG TPA: hypothetical protein PKD05_20740 [Candidatus Melainabacteria bacterium]|nr:hypothetical protein [Candidatus Melainabacteria bacterium]